MGRWGTLCVKLPGGLWLIGPGTRSVVSVALDDAVAYRRHAGLDSPDGCTQCLTPADIDTAAAMQVKVAPLCPDHQLDADAAQTYKDLLDRIGVTLKELAAMRAKGFIKEGDTL